MPESIHLQHKKNIHQKLSQLTECRIEDLTNKLADIYHPEVHWRGSHPFNEMNGVEAINERVWLPLKQSFPDLERRDCLVISGEYDSRHYVGMVGHYCGTFRRPWVTIPATGRTMNLRYGEFHQIEEGKIIQSTVLIDILDVIRQAGFWPIAPSLGAEITWAPPFTGDGTLMVENDPEESRRSLELTLAMHQSLNHYNDVENSTREGFLNMSQKDYWHPKMMWYGPCGIGTARGLQGFVDHHQRPFRRAFPNREAVGHYVRIGDGRYSATSGWPSVSGNHFGDNWLGLAPTGKTVKMRVMDFYLAHEGLIRENWVPIDIIDILKQMGVDVFERMDCFFHPEKYQ